MVLQITRFTSAWQRQQPIVQRPAVKPERALGVSTAGDELVHDAAPHADKFIFRPLAEFGQRHGVHGTAGIIQQRQARGNFNRGGGT